MPYSATTVSPAFSLAVSTTVGWSIFTGSGCATGGAAGAGAGAPVAGAAVVVVVSDAGIAVVVAGCDPGWSPADGASGLVTAKGMPSTTLSVGIAWTAPGLVATTGGG